MCSLKLVFYLIFSVLLPAGERVDRALHLSLAALLGNDIYNFGELVGHILKQHHKRHKLHIIIINFISAISCTE